MMRRSRCSSALAGRRPPRPVLAPRICRTCAAPSVSQQATAAVSSGSQAAPAAESEPPWQQRTSLLLQTERVAQLHKARVLVVGLGGVGSYAAEFLARAGVGALTIVDGDTVDITNTNRQLHALHSTVGRGKAALMDQRLRDIAPTAHIVALNEFLLPERVGSLVRAGMSDVSGSQGAYDWVLDCIDSVEPKKLLITEAHRAGVKVITACGAGGRLDPSRVRVVPLSTTYNDPFAANLRKGLRRRGVVLEQIPAVWSDEPVTSTSLRLTDGSNFKKSYHGTISYLPAQFGLLAAAHVINDLVQGPMAAAYASLATHQWITEERERAKQERAAKRRGGGGGSSASISAAVQVKRSAAISKSNTAAKQSRPQSAAGSKDTQAHSEPVQHASEAVKHDSLQARPSQSPSPRPAQQQRELVQSSSYMSVRAGSLDLASYQDTSYADYGMDI